ncbi:hypothetical protein EHS25_008761 [Saitozyma podzolica]|uniref:Uncharacterized protein n=1 Tax=Saitozyma podzolica TaxID=1890683 RepID=A0A427YMQ0_9TREE|nr:hypothetical protein EHS25_008761 [Saitozyma podzolica]
MEDTFQNGIDPAYWSYEVRTDGYGNHEFEWTTTSTNNSFVQDGVLYIVPTLTADALGAAAITNGYTLNLTADGTCTSSNVSECVAVSNSSTNSIVNPVQSARLVTRGKVSIKYGKVEVTSSSWTGSTAPTRTICILSLLPNLPGAVDHFLAGRTYPLEGTAVLLPQHAPYTDPVTVLVCGGSTPYGGKALDNCVSTQPEAANPTWTIERMPTKRVMTCMVPLPDGTFMIMNGALQGQAGFGLARDANLQALPYDPSQPINSRMSLLNTTIVDRFYHSEAILLHDGRVLVSRSDPETPADPTTGFPGYPQEYRVEVYTPPYLSNGLTQPLFTIINTDWSYNGQYSITVTLHQGTLAGMRVSLVGAVSSTYGNSFGNRVLFPAFSCSGNSCTITAPPNANVCPPGWFQLFVLDGPTPSYSQWVRIGGDPAALGNWPTFPDFTRPGL